ncbi:MAG TPA: hypothetical protein VJN44_08430, partial [Roseateles sp.]|nr:hypothetical protein [Roseateles sp.]
QRRIGRRLGGRAGQHHAPALDHAVGRFGASFHVRTRDRFSMEGGTACTRTAIDEIQDLGGR